MCHPFTCRFKLWIIIWIWFFKPHDWYSGGRRFDPRSDHIFFVEIWSWNNFCGHSLPSTDSSGAVVTYWWKYGHLVRVNRLGSLPRNGVARLTDGGSYVPQMPGYLKTHIIIIMFGTDSMKNWATTWDYGTFHIGDQRRLRRACPSEQSRQSLCCSHTWSMEVDEGSDQKSDI